MSIKELEAALAKVEAQERGSRKLEQADLMYQVIAAIYNGALDRGEAVVKLGSPTWDALREIVDYVEGWA